MSLLSLARSWTPRGRSPGFDESICLVRLSKTLKAFTSTISAKANGAPKDLLIMRKGKSLIPDMGASIQGMGIVRLPIDNTF
jgi:hypothetical protein